MGLVLSCLALNQFNGGDSVKNHLCQNSGRRLELFMLYPDGKRRLLQKGTRQLGI